MHSVLICCFLRANNERRQTDANVCVVSVELKASRTETLIAAVCIDAFVAATAVIHRTLVYIFTRVHAS